MSALSSVPQYTFSDAEYRHFFHIRRHSAFDANDAVDDSRTSLYLVSEGMLRAYTNKFLCEQFLNSSVFLCISSSETTDIHDFNKGLFHGIVVYQRFLSSYFNKILDIFHDFDMWDKSFSSFFCSREEVSSSCWISPIASWCILWIVFDRNYTILGYLRSEDAADPFMEHSIQNGYASPEDILRLQSDGLLSARNAENPPRSTGTAMLTAAAITV